MIGLDRRSPKLKPPLGARVNWSHPLAQGLLGCWLINEGGGASTLEQRHLLAGTLTAGARWVQNGQSPAVECYSNLGGYFTTPFHADWNQARCTVAALCRHITAGNNANPIIASRNYDGTSVPFVLDTSFSFGGVYGGFAFFDGAWHRTATATDVRGDGLTHMITGSYDGATLKYYIDGRLDASLSYAGAMNTANAQPFDIGRYANDTVNFDGYAYGVWFWNRALTEGAIRQHALAPFAMVAPARSPWLDAPAAVAAAAVHDARLQRPILRPGLFKPGIAR